MVFIKGLFQRVGIAGELLRFFWERKLWWMMPMVILLILFGFLMIVAQSAAIAPFMYTLF